MMIPETFDNQSSRSAHLLNSSSSDWGALYCSHLWSDSNLRRQIINAPLTNNRVVKYCYTCKGKIRKYEVKSPRVEQFIPNNYSTPNGKITPKPGEISVDGLNTISSGIGQQLNNLSSPQLSLDVNPCIPTISRQIDSSFRQKYISYEIHPNDRNRRRLRKSLKGIGCIVNFALPDTPVKKRTQIQACSISVMIIAIVVISFILVNFTSPNWSHRVIDVAASKIVVPTDTVSNKSSSAISDVGTIFPGGTTHIYSSTEPAFDSTETVSTESTSLISNVIVKIRKNIRTYPKQHKNIDESKKPKEIIHRDLTKSFCSCQTDEVCMLNENSGTAICKAAVDVEDPTGCGGLCALETEACQVVDRVRGVRVCRLVALMSCGAGQWRCHNGLCVPGRARCDGHIHCYDRSDEMHCDCDLTKQFRCGHSISCFPNTKLCDGVIDCWDGLDEVNCTSVCPDEQFTCTNGECIASARFCDGLADCADGSDEPRGCGGPCGAKELRCRNRRCVPLNMRCDGQDHCGDRTDELHCDGSSTQRPMVAD